MEVKIKGLKRSTWWGVLVGSKRIRKIYYIKERKRDRDGKKESDGKC